MNTLSETHFTFAKQTGFYRGKVRDVYFLGDKMLVIASDRISAFDVILPRPIPHKGQVLNQIAAHFLRATASLVPNWLLSTPDPNVSFGLHCQAYPVEMVVRGYLCGHAWRTYQSGSRRLCGVTLPENMRENDPFLQPILTPTTKAHQGHDEDISREEIISRNLISEKEYTQMEDYSLQLFRKGSEMAEQQGLILADTKYEFGKREGKIYLIDEIHTPDSSRYFYREGFQERQAIGEPQKQLSKEFVREWLMAHGFQGKEGQSAPEMDDAFVERISERYIELFEKITGKNFEMADSQRVEERMRENLQFFL
jgi:phosphoribosylaminoimidazole-succinocarboxamide synthase